MQGVLPVHVTKHSISFVSPAPSLAEEGSGALPVHVHELFFSPGFLGNINIHEIQYRNWHMYALSNLHAVHGSLYNYIYIHCKVIAIAVV